MFHSSLQYLHPVQTDPRLPGYRFDFALVARATDIERGNGFDVPLDRPAGLPGYLLLLTTSGAGHVAFKSGGFDCSAGDMLLIPPQAAHRLTRADEANGWHYRWVYFHPRAFWAPWLQWTNSQGGIGRLHPGGEGKLDRFAALFERIEQANAGRRSTSEQLATNLLEHLLILCHEEGPDFQVRRLDPRVQMACQFIVKHLARDLSLGEIARAACLSPSRLSHVFREQLGVNILRWREDQRIQLAKEMLQGPGRPISAIAARVGYDDYLYFSRVFRKRMGVSPSEYRNSCLQGQAA